MLDENRVKRMTEVALYDKKEHHNIEIAEEYTGRNYVSMRLLRAWVLGTLMFLIFYGMIVLFIYYRYFTTIHVPTLITTLFVGVVCYVVFIFIILRTTGRHARNVYRRAKRIYKEFAELKKQLKQYYQAQETGENNANTYTV